MCDFTIIIPVYNEEENLFPLTKLLVEFMEKCDLKTSVLFINDGSTDGSQQKIESICRQNNGFKFIELQENKGLSAALKVGFDYVESPWTGYMDSDLQVNPDDFLKLLPHRYHYALVNGIRTNRNDSIVKKISSIVANRFRRIFTRDGIADTTCPLKVIKTSFAKKIPMFDGMHRFIPALIQLENGKVHQVPIRHYPRIYGKPKFGVKNRLFGGIIACFIFLWIRRNYITYAIKSKAV